MENRMRTEKEHAELLNRFYELSKELITPKDSIDFVGFFWCCLAFTHMQEKELTEAMLIAMIKENIKALKEAKIEREHIT